MTQTAETEDTVYFSDGKAQGVLLHWWKELTENLPEDAGERPNRRGERAELRRCRSPDDVLLTEAYHRIRKKFVEKNIQFSDADARLAPVIGLLACVKTHQPVQPYESLGVQMAAPRKNSDDARLSGLRFRRLLQIDDRGKLFDAMRRVIRLLDETVDVNQLAKDVFCWSPDSGNSVRKSWARDYYNTAPDED